MADLLKSSPDLERVVEAATAQSVQSAPTATVQGGILPVFWRVPSGMYVSAWWSPTRDRDLRNFWKRSDHLAGAIYNFQAKMTAIPFKIIPKDPGNPAHARQAERLTRELYGAAQFGEGWPAFFGPFLEDLVGTDNGAFAEIIGPGDPSGPLTGPPITLAHLDSRRCQRTGNAQFPVLYTDVSGRMYKLHRSRVIYKAQMPSPIAEMNGVGFCAVSRAINVTQTLIDILTFKQEKLGSRPHRAILITQGGLDPHDVQAAFQIAESAMDSQNLSRYSKVVVAGSSSLMQADIKTVQLSELPDGFDEQTSITLGMATIALALGVDARELFPAMQAGATRADALLQHLKQRGKGPGQIIQMVETAMNYKYLPPHLEMVFDFQDDAQDRQAADTKKVRADRRVQDMSTRALTPRIMREQMLADGDLSRPQFEHLELADGRLPDGTCVLALFYSQDPWMAELLDLGVTDPLDIETLPPKPPSIVTTSLTGEPDPLQAQADAQSTLRVQNEKLALRALINERLAAVQKILISEPDGARRQGAVQAQAALIYLGKYLDNPEILHEVMLGRSAPAAAPPGGNYVDPRTRTQDPTSPDEDGESDPEGDRKRHPVNKPEQATR